MAITFLLESNQKRPSERSPHLEGLYSGGLSCRGSRGCLRGEGPLGQPAKSAACVSANRPARYTEYHAALLAPTGGGAPPVASLWSEGRFEGQVVARLRTLAESAALDFGSEAARGAPVDHLGVLLHLWAVCVERAPWVSNELATDHLAWAEAPLRRMARRGGFYGSVAAATSQLVVVLQGTRVPESKED